MVGILGCVGIKTLFVFFLCLLLIMILAIVSQYIPLCLLLRAFIIFMRILKGISTIDYLVTS